MLANDGVSNAEQAHAQQEQDALLKQLSSSLFYDVRYAQIFAAMITVRMENHALNAITLHQWLKDKKKLENAGGTSEITTLHDAAASVFSFPTHLATLKDKALRRWTLQRTVRLNELAQSENLTVQMLQDEFAEIHERSEQIGNVSMPFIRVITPKKARDFVADPADSMVGEGLIDRGMIITIGGKPGIGKSRLLTTLAVAGARGNGNWMGYPVRCQWRTLLLQTENSGKRLSNEYSCVPEKFDSHILVSDLLSYGLAFDRPEFRRELRAIYERWPFTMLGIDPWNDVTSEEGQSDYKQSLQNIKACFFGLPVRPAIVIIAHLRKAGRDSNGKPKSGREILDELSGSLALGSESRTVFSVQQVTPSMDDPRIVFDVAKANDCEPEWLKEFGTRSAWNRANAAFEKTEVDWETYDNPGKPNNRAITPEMLFEVFGSETVLSRATIVKRMMEKFGAKDSSVYAALPGGTRSYLDDVAEVTKENWIKLKKEK